MGFDIDGVKVLLHARSNGVSFKQVLMLGRQKVHVREADLVPLLTNAGFGGQAAEQIQELRSNEWYAEPLLKLLGAEVCDSMDGSNYEGATVIHDLNLPIPESISAAYSLVIDGGCLEHVANVFEALKSAISLVRPGGHFMGFTIANNFAGHGFYQFSPELFFRTLDVENGYAETSILCYEANQYNRATYYRVVDPAVIRSRIDIVNGAPLYMTVISKRVSDKKPLSAGYPIQSDYQDSWASSSLPNQKSASDTNRFFSSMCRRLTWFVSSVTCSCIKRVFGYHLVALPKSPFDEKGFREITLDLVQNSSLED